MSTDDTKPKLTFVQKVVIAGEEFDLAKNGHFALVKPRGVDAYDREYGELVNLEDEMEDGSFGFEQVQSLLDLLGEALAGVRHSRDQRLGTGTGGDE